MKRVISDSKTVKPLKEKNNVWIIVKNKLIKIKINPSLARGIKPSNFITITPLFSALVYI